MANVTTSEVREILKSAVDTFDSTGVGDDQSLGDAGMDSLDKANLFLAIEEKLGVKISDDLFEELDSISAIADQVSTIAAQSNS